VLVDTPYDLVLYCIEYPDGGERILSELTNRARTDGVLIISIYPNEVQTKRFLRSSVPIILIDIEHSYLSSIFIDNLEGGYLATKHLIDLGHRRIAFISDYLEPEYGFSAMQARYNGYLKALKEAGIEFMPQYHRLGPHDREAGYQLTKQLLTLEQPPTAIFASSDTQGVGVLMAAREMGYRVPEDLSIIGFDGIRDSEYVNMTTVSQPLFESGIEGAKLLLSSMAKETVAPVKIQLPIQIIHRGSTHSPA
jgi:LacI family transcriptional regulator